MHKSSNINTLRAVINDFLISSIAQAFPELDNHSINPVLQVATIAGFGDYQSNGAMALAKQLKVNPRDVASSIVTKIEANNQKSPIFSKIEIAGPGFINLWLDDKFLSTKLKKLFQSDDLDVDINQGKGLKVAIDYSSPNVAKEMHIGHLRSTIIGDSFARILGFLGYDVIRQNHLGDWGTQFGMLIQYLIENRQNKELKEKQMSDLNFLYKESKKLFDHDINFAKKARNRVVLLQQGDKETNQYWHDIVDNSVQYFQNIYSDLGVLLTQDDVKGESFYNNFLKQIVEKLDALGLVELSDGAKVIFLEGFETKEKKPLPFMIQKSDGGFLYATTDLAAANYRINDLNAGRIIYVTDARQKQHFEMLFGVLNKANLTKDVKLEHICFGAILGADRKPFKTRSGETIKLSLLIQEAKERAYKLVSTKNPELSEHDKRNISAKVGIGALKYADLCNDKIKDYIFDWDKMLAFDGNTAPYLQNAYVRIKAIFRKVDIDNKDILNFDMKNLENFISDNNVFEHNLTLGLLSFKEIIYDVADNLELHKLCNYLYNLASTFHKFYENCSISKAENDDIRRNRLILCSITAETLRIGLSLLGIDVLDLM